MKQQKLKFRVWDGHSMIKHMIFQEYIRRSKFKPVFKRILSIHCSDGNKLENKRKTELSYASVWTELLCLKAIKNKNWAIIVEKCKNDGFGECYDGRVYSIKRGLKETYAIEFTKWEKLLGMEVSSQYDIDDTVAYIIYEITFCGFNQKDIQNRLNCLKDRVASLKINHREVKPINLRDIRRKLKNK